MKRRLLILACTVVVMVVLVAFRTLTARDATQRNLEIFTEMTYSVGYESFTSHPDLPGGVTMQEPVPGTVIRGRMPFRYGAGEEEAQRAGRELVNPYSHEDAAAVARGAEIYRIYCVACHDAGGGGRGPVVLRGMIPPPSLLAERARAMPDGQVYHLLTLGQGNMASYAAQIEPEDRWKVILYMRSLQEGSGS